MPQGKVQCFTQNLCDFWILTNLTCYFDPGAEILIGMVGARLTVGDRNGADNWKRVAQAIAELAREARH
jgi:hypothetical protein